MYPRQRKEGQQVTSYELYEKGLAAGGQTRGQATASSASPPSRNVVASENTLEFSTENTLLSSTNHFFNEGGSQCTRSHASSVFSGVTIGAMTSQPYYGPSSQMMNSGNYFPEGFAKGSVDIANIPTNSSNHSSNPFIHTQLAQDRSESHLGYESHQTNLRFFHSHNHQFQPARYQASHPSSGFGVFHEPSFQNQRATQRAIGDTNEGTAAAFERFIVGEVELQQDNEFNSTNTNGIEDLETSFANIGISNNLDGQKRSLASRQQCRISGTTMNSAGNLRLFRNRGHTLSPAVSVPDPFVEHAFDGNMADIQQRPRFQPSDMLIRCRAQTYLPPLQGTGMLDNSRYQGDASSRSYMNQFPGLQDEFNCALWLTNIPPTVTMANIFDVIDCGSVAALHVNRPDINHTCAAAKLIFKEPGNARTFYIQARAYGMWLHGHRIQVKFNRNGHFRWEGPQTRVLRVDGPEHLMTFDYWSYFFRNICVFDGDRALEIGSSTPGRKTMEFRFDRIDGQSQMCLGGIVDSYDPEEVRAWYGPDPCDPASRGLFVM